MTEGLVVQEVEPGSIAAEMGITPGDRLLTINEVPLEDIIGYRFYLTDEHLKMAVAKESGEHWLMEIDKDYDEDLGVTFVKPFSKIYRCRNRCLFCFVHQMPPGLRSSLYFKDDDYRLSFWEGNFVTLTNAGTRDLQRIAEQRLSPLYISVHTTNPALRQRMMGHPRAGKILEQVAFLKAAGIEMHTQVVLCPGINDGSELRRTVRELAALWAGVRSLAVVPVGRTRFREGLYPLRGFTREEAREVVGEVAAWQRQYRGEFGSAFVYAADEFYLQAGLDVPPAEVYEDFAQLENGIGLVRLFLDEWRTVEQKLQDHCSERRITLVTGRSGESVLAPVGARLNRVEGLTVDLALIENDFFGRTVTVSGLLTGTDIRNGLLNKHPGELVIIPAASLRDGYLFLDDTTLPELEQVLAVPVVAASGPEEMVRHIFGGQSPVND